MDKTKLTAYLNDYNRREAAEWIKQKSPQEVKTIIRQADRLLNHQFTFQDTWDMEPCSVPYELNPMVWDQSPNHDPEWIFMLNRHSYLHKLLLAYWFTGNSDYAEKLKFFLFHWIAHNPITDDGGVTIRTIDTGIRCMSWIPLVIHLYGEELMDEEEYHRILASMREQFLYLRRSYKGNYTLSNWGVLQTTAICTACLWFGEELNIPELYDWAWKELEEQLDLQILKDGSHWEQSVLYHMEVLNTCSRLWYTCCLLGEEINHPWLSGLLQKMTSYVQYAAAPDHHQIAQGDSDSTDVRDVLTKSAVLFLNGTYKSGGFSHLDPDSVWMFGKPGIQAYGELKAKKPETRSGFYPDGGAVCLRSSWEEDASYTCLLNGPLGSSHGHVDQTHISLYYKGKSFLTDSGRYTYVEEEPLRPWLKSAYAHNVCVIDQEPHGKPAGSWGYDSYGDCLKNYYREDREIHYAEMAYTGNLKDGSFYLAARKVIVIDPGIWFLVQDLRCDGEHKAEEICHLHPRVTAGYEKQGDKTCLRLTNEDSVLIMNSQTSFDMGSGVSSERYNETEEHCILNGKTQWKNRLISWTSFSAEGITVRETEIKKLYDESVIGNETAFAVEFTVSSELSYTVLVFHQETCKGRKLFYCHGVPLYGKVVVLKNFCGVWERVTLRI